MTKYNEMNATQRNVYDACCNGWFMGGRYRAHLNGSQHDFFADTAHILAREVEPWYAKHQERHAGGNLVVKCVQAL
ncbi:MAG: hypothetical protein PUD09_08165 [Coriobacteriales bacterium]|nr:hypothetical protein [Coriobacteriales bacterium]